ncbi:hypothetical protein [Saccharothrix hoggarensis]|uniref:Mutator family transposase n=1 Tax=Saccharothrix hoggarensis TaxID=913853 RepID=A0ABW3QR06_9PSEU
MDDTQVPADDELVARLRDFLGQAPDTFDDVAVKVVRDRLANSPEPVADERGSGDSSR